MSTDAKAVKTSKRRLSYEKKKGLYGYGFIGLWLVGTLIFFIVPLVTSFWYSLNDVTIGEGEMLYDWVGLKNYDYVLTVDENYADYLSATLLETLWKTPLVLIF